MMRRLLVSAAAIAACSPGGADGGDGGSSDTNPTTAQTATETTTPTTAPTTAPTTDGGDACPGPAELLCGSECVDISSNSGHCGACGHECGAGNCIGKQCECFAGAELCGELCVQLKGDDSENCGLCGRSCQGAECVDGSCEGEFIAQSPERVLRMAGSGDTLFWVGPTTVFSVPFDGGTPTPLAEISSDPAVTPVAFAAGQAHVYVGLTDGALVRVPMAGGTPEPFATDTDPVEIATHAGKVYWSGELGTSAGLLVADEAVGTPTLLVSEPARPLELAVDAAGVLYVISADIVATNLDGTGRTVLSTHPYAGETSRLAANANEVFLGLQGSGFETGGVWVVPRSGGAGTWLGKFGSGYTNVMAVAANDVSVCWGNANNRAFCRAQDGSAWYPVDGGGQDVLLHAPFVYSASNTYQGAPGTIITRVAY